MKLNLLPHDPVKLVRNPSGIRLGVEEFTRWGAGVEDVSRIAELFRRVLIEKAPPEKDRPLVKALKGSLDTVQFCFPAD